MESVSTEGYGDLKDYSSGCGSEYGPYGSGNGSACGSEDCDRGTSGYSYKYYNSKSPSLYSRSYGMKTGSGWGDDGDSGYGYGEGYCFSLGGDYGAGWGETDGGGKGYSDASGD